MQAFSNKITKEFAYFELQLDDKRYEAAECMASVMNNNPFSPNIGRPPAFFAGRSMLLQEFERALEGPPNDPVLFSVVVGSSGIGKTAFLGEVAKLAIQKNWIPVHVVASDNLLFDVLDSIRFGANHLLDADQKIRMRSIDVDCRLIKMTFDRMENAGNSWMAQMEAYLAELSSTQIGLFICVDEILKSCESFNLFLEYCQLFNSRGYRLAFLGAGLPYEIERLFSGHSASFRSRVRRVTLDVLTAEEAAQAFVETAACGERRFSEDAVSALVDFCGGHPYALQLAGYYAWREADQCVIQEDAALRGIAATSKHLAEQIVLPQLEALSYKQLCYLEVLAQLDTPAYPSDVAAALGVSEALERVVRIQLQRAGLLQSGSRKDSPVAFKIPFLRDYLSEEA